MLLSASFLSEARGSLLLGASFVHTTAFLFTRCM